MYEAFADYWVDMLDNMPFSPDYISIQNEPSWITPDWETCEWRPTETADFPGYVNAFDLVYEKIGTRSQPAKLIGPEAEISAQANSAETPLRHFLTLSKTKPIWQPMPIIHITGLPQRSLLRQLPCLTWYVTTTVISHA